MSNISTLKKCPYCGTVGEMKLDGDQLYTCLACEQTFSKAQIDGNTSVDVGSFISENIRNIESPVSAIDFLDLYFETFDWSKFELSADLFVDELKLMVERNKIKNTVDPKTWELEFIVITRPLTHKLEALKAKQLQIFDKYIGDVSAVSEDLLTYINVAGSIVASRELIIKILEKDIANMIKYNADESAVNVAKSTLGKLKAALGEISVETTVENLPEVKKIAHDKEKKQISEFSNNGIDAVETYENGLAAYEAGRYGYALGCFERVRGFRNSFSYIYAINSLFMFGDVIEAGGRLFKIDDHRYAPIDMSKAKKKNNTAEEEEEPRGVRATYDLYEIVDGIVVKEPVVKSVSKVLTVYGDYIYFLKRDKELCAYNASTKLEKQIDRSEFGYDLENRNAFGFSYDHKKIYVRKHLKISQFKKGCNPFGRKKKEREYYKSQQNNFSMGILTLENASMLEKIPKMVGCICGSSYVFFTESEVVGESKKTGKEYKNIAKMYNMDTDTTDILFEKNCEILDVNGTKVIYSFWTPNYLNRELHVIDYMTKEDTLVEANAYKYICTNKNKLFYKIGNKNVSPLYSANLDGTERTELLPHFEGSDHDIGYVNGQVYLRKNSMLLKISADGKDKLIVAYDIGNLLKLCGNFLYYIDNSANKSFRIASLDGATNVRIADGIEPDDISIGIKYVYYVRKERVSNTRKSGSLYRMDLDGHNVTKLIFDIEEMKDKDPLNEGADIYVRKREQKDYRFFYTKKRLLRDPKFPFLRKSKEFEVTFPITSYYTVDKQVGELKLILVLGTPDTEDFARKGCNPFSKKKYAPEVEEIFPEIDYNQITEEPNEALTLNLFKDALTASSNKKNKKR